VTDLWVSEMRQGVETGKSAQRLRRQRSWEVDVQRARVLRGDALEELTESQREWVWRSLLRGVRLSQVTKLAQLAPEETPQALQQVANRYSALMDQRRRDRRAASVDDMKYGHIEQGPYDERHKAEHDRQRAIAQRYGDDRHNAL
jgi:hypothetical protein